jgi:hypothetical protein
MGLLSPKSHTKRPIDVFWLKHQRAASAFPKPSGETAYFTVFRLSGWSIDPWGQAPLLQQRSCAGFTPSFL